jgi:predicted transcriptional regulator
MTTKGLVRRDESRRSHVYRAAVSREHTQRRMLGELLEGVFAGSRRTLVMQLLAGRRSSPEELAEIRAMIDAAERDKR